MPKVEASGLRVSSGTLPGLALAWPRGLASLRPIFALEALSAWQSALAAADATSRARSCAMSACALGELVVYCGNG